MSYSVIGMVNIDFNCKVTKALKQDMEKLLKKDGCSYYNLSATGNNLSFDIWGNKYLDNSIFEIIKKKFKKYILEINCNEYVESGEGYYYSKKA